MIHVAVPTEPVVEDDQMHSITLVRVMPQRPRTPIKKQIAYIVGVALRGARGTSQGWKNARNEFSEQQIPTVLGGGWKLVATLTFKKTSTHAKSVGATSSQWEKIIDMVSLAGSSSKFNKYPWVIKGDDEFPTASNGTVPATPRSDTVGVDSEKFAPGVSTQVVPEHVSTVEDAKKLFPHELLEASPEDSNRLIEEHPAFKGIYERGPQIRIALSSIWTFLESNRACARHFLFYGLPACAKTGILRGIVNLFGLGSTLKLDSTSTTRAGLERLVFKSKKEGGLEEFPLFVQMEEIEKVADESALNMWLAAMDERCEFRKVKNNVIAVRQVHFLGMGTANDLAKIDAMMGGKSGDKGALSSRFAHQLKCGRPDEKTMRRILHRDLPKINGKIEWIEPCIQLAREMGGIDDPRQVLAFLDGRDRLLTGDYQKDQLALYQR